MNEFLIVLLGVSKNNKYSQCYAAIVTRGLERGGSVVGRTERQTMSAAVSASITIDEKKARSLRLKTRWADPAAREAMLQARKKAKALYVQQLL